MLSFNMLSVMYAECRKLALMLSVVYAESCKLALYAVYYVC